MKLFAAIAAMLATLSVAVAAESAAAPADEEKEDTFSVIRGLLAEVIRSDKVIRLNLGAKAPHHRFAAVIYPEEFLVFSNLNEWEGKAVEIKGEVADYGGRPQILLKSAQQLRLLATAARKAVAQAPQATGEQATVRGQVAEILSTDQIIRIHLGAKSPDHRAAAIIYPDRFGRFSDLQHWLGKPVEITGERVNLPGCPQVLLQDPRQITPIQTSSPPAPDDEPPTTGKQATIRGTVAEVLRSEKMIRIHLGAKAPYQHFSALVYPRNFAAFPEAGQLEGKAVEISGAVANLGGREQIILESPRQVTMLDRAGKRGH